MPTMRQAHTVHVLGNYYRITSFSPENILIWAVSLFPLLLSWRHREQAYPIKGMGYRSLG